MASVAPSVTTKSASGIGDTSATLNGSVAPNGQATTVVFEYGTSTGYGAKTAAKNAGSGTGTSNTSAAVTGLSGGTTYHFRIVATNAAGTNTGADQTFTTSGKPAVQTGAPTAVTGTSATLTGTVDPAGHSTSWYFEFGTSTAYGTKTASQSCRLERRRPCRLRPDRRPDAGHDLPLPARRGKQLRHERRRRRDLDDRRAGRDACDVERYGRGGQPGDAARQSGRRAAGPARLPVRVEERRLVHRRRDDPHRCGRHVEHRRQAADPHDVQGALRRRQRRDDGSRPAGGHAPHAAVRTVCDTRRRSPFVQGPRRAAPAAPVQRQLGHDRASAARRGLEGRLPSAASTWAVGATRCDRRQAAATSPGTAARSRTAARSACAGGCARLRRGRAAREARRRI